VRWTLAALAIAVALANAKTPAEGSPAAYSLDGIVLGSNVGDLIKTRGTPESTKTGRYSWINSAGGLLSVAADPSGNITVIDVRAGAHEYRPIQLPGGYEPQRATLGATGHMNYAEPREATADTLCANLRGEPCESFLLPPNTALIVNFGKNCGLSDWSLSEIILANRDVLLASDFLTSPVRSALPCP
jgi:hypothetical protein